MVRHGQPTGWIFIQRVRLATSSAYKRIVLPAGLLGEPAVYGQRGLNMKLKLSIIGLALLASALPSYAGGIMMMGGGVGATVSNGEVGNKSGTNDDTVTPNTYPGNDQGLIGCFSAGTSGTIGYIHARLASSSGSTGQQYNGAIYSDTGTLIADGTMRDEPGTVPGTISFQLDSSTTVTQGSTYCLIVGAHNSPDGWSLSSTNIPGSNTYHDTTFTVGNTMPSSADVTTNRISNYVPRIWATNTADGS